MSNPGNKRRQRAKYGSSPSAEEGETVTTTYRSNGRTYTVTRQTGSVINNGGNMEAGLYPRIGMSLGFLRRTRATEDCGACVANEDVASVTPLDRARAQVGALAVAAALTAANNAANALSVARLATAAAVTALNNATTSAAITTAQTALDAARVTEATELADYNESLANKAASDAADAYITANTNTVAGLVTYNAAIATFNAIASPSAADRATLAAAKTVYDGLVTTEATALAAWLAAEL